MKGVLVVGATSSLARALAGELAAQGCRLFLAGRDLEETQRVAADLHLRHQVPVASGSFEATQMEGHERLLEEAERELGGIDGAVFAVGWLGEQPSESEDPASACRLIDINLKSAVSLLGRLANRMEAGGDRFLLALTSVAGDRGRPANYAYGAAKGGLNLYLEGLRGRLRHCGVRVITIKLGPVDTAMTYGLAGLAPVVSPESAARTIARILGKPAGVYYVPGFWRWIMLVVRHLPARCLERMEQ